MEPLTPSFAGIEQLASVWLPLSEKLPTFASVPFSVMPGFQYQSFHGESAPSAALRLLGKTIAPWPRAAGSARARIATAVRIISILRCVMACLFPFT